MNACGVFGGMDLVDLVDPKAMQEAAVGLQVLVFGCAIWWIWWICFLTRRPGRRRYSA